MSKEWFEGRSADMRPIEQIVIHCSATPDGNAAFGRAELDRMHRERGWKGIGYHFVVEVDGSVKVGRPVEQVGAHVEGNNAKTIGICMIGTARFAPAQWKALRDLVSSLQKEFPATSVWGHRDYSPDKNGDGVIDSWEWFKLCPGFAVDAWRLSGMDPQWNLAHVLP